MGQLLTKEQVLKGQIAASPEQRKEGLENDRQPFDHASTLDDLQKKLQQYQCGRLNDRHKLDWGVAQLLQSFQTTAHD